MIYFAFLLSIFVCSLPAIDCKPPARGAEVARDGDLLDRTLNKLLTKLLAQQTKVDVPEYRPPFRWQRQKGLYPAHSKLYLHGSVIDTALRNIAYIYDNNFFATAWVTTQLVEASIYGNFYPHIPEESISSSVDALANFYDKNQPDGSSIVIFWSQVFNVTRQLWTTNNANTNGLGKFVHETVPWKFLRELLTFLHWKKLLDDLETSEELFDIFKRVSAVPSDFDDSSINLGLGAVLKLSKFTDAFDGWSSHNGHPEALAFALKRYAYRPFQSENNETNLIDPRTYYYARGFIQAAAENNRSLALVSTWVTFTGHFSGSIIMLVHNLTDSREQDPLVVTPLLVNNIDCTVAANAIYGLTAAVIMNVGDATTWFDSDLQQIYRNSSDFIAWAIESGTIERRPDLALTYYPSAYTFYWFVARSLFLLETAAGSERDVNLQPELESTRLRFQEIRPVISDWLLSKANPVSKSVRVRSTKEEVEMVYFEDFLGNGDTLFGYNISYGEDRIVSTANAVNTLIALYATYSQSSNKLSWASDVPLNVVLVVKRAVNWLVRHSASWYRSHQNAFYSGSIKGLSTFPTVYPFNYLKDLNGTEIPLSEFTPGDFNMHTVAGVQGVIDEDEYQTMIRRWDQELHKYNMSFPFNFPGYNDPSNSGFPYWSAPAFTYSSAVLALAQFRNLEQTMEK